MDGNSFASTLLKPETMKTIIFTLTIVSAIFLASCSEEKKLLRKASNAVNEYDFDKAITYYDKILAKDSNSFYGNAGKGIVLSERMGRYDQAIPYLERAVKKSPKETSMKINNDLGMSYHYVGNYPRALYFYGKAANENVEGNPDYDMFLSKRIADCKYALDHPGVAPPKEQSVANIGSTINTSMPEYGPIYTDGKLIFTSKRQDSPKEKKNGIDGRYFESIYISNVTDNKFSAPRRYTLPDYGDKSNFKRGSESALSVSPDGKTLYIFRRGKLYEANLNDSTESEHKLAANINFTEFQSFASVTSDGKVLFFSSDAKKGVGGLDIYKSVKDENGKWSDPELLPISVNTDYNEDAPFITEDGTLFFASDGLPGYGGYDIYKTHMENGQWTVPVNIGQPINTPGDDVYFALKPNSADGYYSSSRQGGFGDQDIYKVHYVSMDEPSCETTDSMFVINATQDPSNDYAYNFTLSVPDKYKNNIKSISWKVNDESVALESDKMHYAFANKDVYKVYAKAVVYCDDCPVLVAKCAEKEITVGEGVIVKNEIKEIAPQVTTLGELDNNQLLSMGWNINPGYFDYNESFIRSDAKVVFDQNIKVLKANRDLSIVISGYADSRGTEVYNKGLSAKRANTVKDYFIKNGISTRRITETVAYGESKITNGCTDDVECDEQKHQENRRVDFKVSNDNKFITSVSAAQP